MTLKETAVRYYAEENYNCSESILRAANDVYGLGLTEREFKLLAPYGAGCCVGSLCGAVAGGVSTIGALRTEEKWRGSASMATTKKFMTLCRERMGSELCKEIKSSLNTPALRCQKVIEITADTLAEVLENK